MGRAGPDVPPAHRVFQQRQRGAVDHLGEGAAAVCAGGPVIGCAAPADPDDQRRRDPRPRPASPLRDPSGSASSWTGFVDRR